LVITKLGDLGETDFFNGERVKKTDPRIGFLSDFDFFVCVLGVFIYYVKKSGGNFEILESLQDFFMKLPSLMFDKKLTCNLMEVENWAKILEEEVRKIEEKTGKIKSFIKPRGNFVFCFGNLARSSARKLELKFWEIKESYKLNEIFGVFLNRVSDFLFVFTIQNGRD